MTQQKIKFHWDKHLPFTVNSCLCYRVTDWIDLHLDNYSGLYRWRDGICGCDSVRNDTVLVLYSNYVYVYVDLSGCVHGCVCYFVLVFGFLAYHTSQLFKNALFSARAVLWGISRETSNTIMGWWNKILLVVNDTRLITSNQMFYLNDK